MMAEASAALACYRDVMYLPHRSAVDCPVVDAQSLGAFFGLTNSAGAGKMFLVRPGFKG
jgi:hypothetical protein